MFCCGFELWWYRTKMVLLCAAFHGRGWKLPPKSRNMTKYVRKSYQLLLRYVIYASSSLSIWSLLVYLNVLTFLFPTGTVQVSSCRVCIIYSLLPFIDIWSTTWLWILEALVSWFVLSWRYWWTLFMDTIIWIFFILISVLLLIKANLACWLFHPVWNIFCSQFMKLGWSKLLYQPLRVHCDFQISKDSFGLHLWILYMIIKVEEY